MIAYKSFKITKDCEKKYREILDRKIGVPEDAASIYCIDDEDCGVQWTLLYQVVKSVRFDEKQVTEIIKRKDIVERGIFLKPEQFKLIKRKNLNSYVWILAKTLNKNDFFPTETEYMVVNKNDMRLSQSRIPILEEKNKNLINDYRGSELYSQLIKEFESTPLHEVMKQITTKEQIDYLFTIPKFKTLDNSLGKTPLKELLETLILRYEISRFDCKEEDSDDMKRCLYGKRFELVHDYIQKESEFSSKGIPGIIKDNLRKKANKARSTFRYVCEDLGLFMSTVGVQTTTEIKELIIYTVKKIGLEYPDYWFNKVYTDNTINLCTVIDHGNFLEKELEQQIIDEIEKSSVIAKEILKNTYRKGIKDRSSIMATLVSIWEKKPSDFILDGME